MRSLVWIAFVLLMGPLLGCLHSTVPEAENLQRAPVRRPSDLKRQEVGVSDEAQLRRERSVQKLEAENVPVLGSLPVIESEAESTRRTSEQVALRAMALCVVAVKGEGVEQRIIDQLVDEYKIDTAFTPEEKAFISNPNPTQHERTQFVWRYECYWVMLWALGLVEELERPDTICDVPRAVSLLKELGREGLLESAKLRTQTELLDAADLAYRYHWAVRDARINGRDIPAGLDGGVVMERHYALNWLIGYLDQEWDNISTDT